MSFRSKSLAARTPAQSQRFAAIKEIGCLACLQRNIVNACEVNHLLTGGHRTSHDDTIGLCKWHHRSQIDVGMTGALMRKVYGPSLTEGSKPFHAEFGSDADLLAEQNRLIAVREVVW